MAYKDKTIARPSSSSAPIPESDSTRIIPMMPHPPSSQPGQRQTQAHGPVAILWDMENCPVPSDVRPEDVAANIRSAIRAHRLITGVVTSFSAYGDFNAFPRRLREGCQRTGVKLVDVPNGRKDAADKAILVDMFLFALDNRPPSSIILISGDVDFAPALHILGQRGYNMILVIPSGVGVSTALYNAGSYVWDWPSVARGDGLVPPKGVVPRGFVDITDVPNEEEAIVYRGTGSMSREYSHSNSSRVNREFCNRSSFNVLEGQYGNSSRARSLSCSLARPAEGMSEDPILNSLEEQDKWWVRPGDLLGLKGQLVRLLELSGGAIPLVRVPSEYLKLYGRPLYVAEYGVFKLVHLVDKMNDVFLIVGKGHKKMLCLKNSCDANNVKKCARTPVILKREKKGNQSSQEEKLDSSSDDCSDDERDGNLNLCLDSGYEFAGPIESFRQEVQELLVCYCGPVKFTNFENLYEQRYKKQLDYSSFGVANLEGLIEKVGDVVGLYEDEGTKKKYLLSSFVSG